MSVFHSLATRVLAALLLAFLLGGCSLRGPAHSLGSGVLPEGATVIGPARGEATSVYLLGFCITPDGGAAEAIRVAVQGTAGADALVNVICEAHDRTVLGLVSWQKVVVHGTAVSMPDVGWSAPSPRGLQTVSAPMDPTSVYLRLHVESGPSASFRNETVDFAELFAAYAEHCGSSGQTPLDEERFLHRLKQEFGTRLLVDETPDGLRVRGLVWRR